MNFFSRVWRFLVRTHPSIVDIEEKRQSKLLAGLILALIVTSLLASFLLIMSDGGLISDTVKVLWIALVATTGLFFLNRNGRYRVSAAIFVVYNFLVTYTMPVITNDLAWLMFPIMTLLLSAMLLPEKITADLLFTGLLSHLLLWGVYPQSAEFSNLGVTIVYLVTAPLLLVFMNHRSSIEQERQQELRAANNALRISESNLEKRVADRTRDLKVASYVSRQITTELDLDQLLPQLVATTKASFNLSVVSVFLYHIESQQLILAAGTEEIDQKMKAGSYSVHLDNQNSLIAKAARKQQNIINNVDSEKKDALINSEAFFPMTAGDELVGVLELQSEAQGRFGSDEIEIFGTLTEQIAIAVRNAQLYAEQTELMEELKESDRTKSQFLANMSHELRTPLNAIMNFTEMIGMGMMGPVNEEQANLLEQSLDSSKHLLNLINDVLDISKIQAGKLNLFIENVTVQSV